MKVGIRGLLVPTLETEGSNLMQAREAQKGTAVRVREGNRREALWGLVGTVEHMWGHPDHPALDVRLQDGHTELFWFYELDKLNDPHPN